MSRQYRLVFRGKYLPGLTPEEVHANVAALFRAPVERVRELLSTLPAIIKQDLGVEHGSRYQEALAEVGLITHLELVTDDTGAPIEPGSWDGVERRAGAERRHRADRREARRGASIQPDRRQNRGRRKTDNP